jgi:hypothetical protein
MKKATVRQSSGQNVAARTGVERNGVDLAYSADEGHSKGDIFGLWEYFGYGELFTRKKHGFQKCDFWGERSFFIPNLRRCRASRSQ